MKRKIFSISLMVCFIVTCFSAYGLYAAAPQQSQSNNVKKALPADVKIKQFQPFTKQGNLLIPAAGLASDQKQSASPRYKEGEVLVKFKKGVTASSAKSKVASLNMTVEKEFSVLSQIKGQPYVLVKSKTQKTIDLIAQFKNDPSVETATPNYERRISATTPNDPLFSYLWGLNNTGQDIGCGAGTPDADIDAPEAWDINTGSSGVVVADIDTGVDYTHVDLASNMWHNPGEVAGNGIDDDGNGYIDDVYGIDAYNYDSDPMDDHGHGTHTSGTMAAAGNNNIGVTGVGWNTKVMALKFLSAGGGGYDADAITCIEYIIYEKLYHNVNVVAINASWGGGGYSQVLRDAIEEAGNAGIIFCAAAGNWVGDTDVSPNYPSCYDVPSIISVAASDHNDQLPEWSGYGATSVDLAAPGDCTFSTYPGCSGGNNIFFDDMESGAGNWIVVDSDTTNTWTLNTEAAYSPTHAWSDSPGGNYSNNTDSSLALSHDIDLSSYSAGTVTFYIYATGYLEYGFDRLYAEFSADSGATWTTYGSLSGDFSGGWYYLPGDIPNEFKTAHFRMRFRLVTDSSVTYDGLYIDDVGIYSCQQSDNYAFMAGTSMATPHVTGAVGVLAAHFPGDDVQTRKSRILCGVDQKPAFSGKMVTGGRLNLYNSFTCSNDSPVISSIAPTCVAFSEISSTTVNIYGSNFENGASVTVGGIPAAQTSVLSADHIQIKLPSLSNGTYDITVTNPDNQSATSANAVRIADTCDCRIYFDTYHGYVAGDYSQFISYFNPDIKNEPITETSLSGYNILALFIPLAAFSSDELSAINAFAANGGRVVVLGEWGPGFDSNNAILEAITLPVGIDFNSNAIYDDTDYWQGANYWPILHVFGSSPITDGLSQVVILAGSSFTLSGQAEGLVFGDSDTYVQMLSNIPGNITTDGKAMLAATGSTVISSTANNIVAAARSPLGKGDIIAIGDSNLWADSYNPLSVFDNFKFAQNVFTCPSTTPGCTEDDSGQLDVVGASGNPGSSVTFTVRVQNAPNAVDALGFEVTFDPGAMQYVGFTLMTTTNNCVAGFDYFDVNPVTPGVVRCGGFTTVNPIPAGANCDVVQLHFAVIGVSCEVGTCPGTVGLQNLVDGMTGWSASHGCFCCGCVCDINGDGNCTPQDALCSFQKYLGICPTSCGPCEDICCDVNKDGACTPADALCRFQEYLGIHPNCFD